jgi:Flp pilus assembly pilin Flp
MITFLRKLRSDDRGISALEYALLAGAILVVVGGVLSSTDLGGTLKSIFEGVQEQLEAVEPPAAPQV